MRPTPDEVMTVAAARKLTDRTVCFVGIGLRAPPPTWPA
jgi:acyl CoA:acetate/3-ketoacid CoA transferase beta subunit